MKTYFILFLLCIINGGLGCISLNPTCKNMREKCDNGFLGLGILNQCCAGLSCHPGMNRCVTEQTSEACNCGRKKTTRIFGGKETEINEYPWMAAIKNTKEEFFCGGTVITAEWIVTASHCMYKDEAYTIAYKENELRVVLGEHDKSVSGEETIPRIVREVSQIIRHPDFDVPADNIDKDIALIKLKGKVNLKVYTPACLPAAGATFVGEKAWVYGWGLTPSGSYSNKLLEVQVPVVSNAVCKAAMGDKITEFQVCAGGEPNKDSCRGDSGGPLTVDVDGKHFLIGDVSFGPPDGCGKEGLYGVYAKVAKFRTWMDAYIGSASNNCP